MRDRQTKKTQRCVCVCVCVRGDEDHKEGSRVREGRCAALDRGVREGWGQGKPTFEQRLEGGEE